MTKEKFYKAFNNELKCRDMQYEIGKEYVFDGKPIPCKQGFHYCKSIADCYKFYDTTEYTRICEVEPLGDVSTDDDVKYCTNKIKIVAEIENPRLRSNLSETSTGYCNCGSYNSGDFNSGIRNSGNYNSGDFNSGNHNSGDSNSGYCNSGNHNSGDCNSGIRNSGYYNSGKKNSGDNNIGDYNSGDKNIGDYNSGNFNSGDCNSGDFNSGNRNSGIFNTSKKPNIKMFDKDSDWTYEDWYNSRAYKVMIYCPYSHPNFINESSMTEEEKRQHPEYKTMGGYTKVYTVTTEYKQEWWNNLSESDKQAVYDLPNFDADKFRKCTGIEVENINRRKETR